MASCNVELVLIGAGESAREYGDIFLGTIPEARDTINQTSIRETIEVLRLCDYYLGGDTGPMHLAVALGLGGAAVFKTSRVLPGVVHNPAVWFSPWRSKIAICQPDSPLAGCEKGCEVGYPHCIKLVTPQQVFDEMKRQIEGGTP